MVAARAPGGYPACGALRTLVSRCDARLRRAHPTVPCRCRRPRRLPPHRPRPPPPPPPPPPPRPPPAAPAPTASTCAPSALGAPSSAAARGGPRRPLPRNPDVRRDRLEIQHL